MLGSRAQATIRNSFATIDSVSYAPLYSAVANDVPTAF